MWNSSLFGVRCINLKLHRDQRGFFSEIFRAHKMEKFAQINHSRSVFGTLRGLHYQPYMAKVVHCPVGEIFDVVFDLETGQHLSFVLNKDNVLYVPEGMAHGFLALQDSDVVYACTDTYDPETEGGTHWTSGGIVWPFEPTVISEKDQRLPRWRGLREMAG